MSVLNRSKPFLLAVHAKPPRARPGRVVIDVVRFETCDFPTEEFKGLGFTLLNPDDDPRARVMIEGITHGRPLIRIVAAHAPECSVQAGGVCDCHARGWGEPGDVLLEFQSQAGYVRLNMRDVCAAIEDGRLPLPTADKVGPLRQWVLEQQPR